MRLHGIMSILRRKPCLCGRNGNGGLGVLQEVQRSISVTCNEAALNSLNEYNHSAGIAEHSHDLYVISLVTCSVGGA